MATVLAMQQAIPGKRQATSMDDVETSNNRKRGRPKVNKSDASAADRRRTQIRLAQRAYRQRKESTLEELKKQVADLVSVITSLSQTFQDCQERLITSGITEQQNFHLRHSATKFADIIGSAALTEGATSNDEDNEKPPSTISTSSSKPLDALAPKNVSVWLDQAELAKPQRLRADDDFGMGYTILSLEDAQSPWKGSAGPNTPFDSFPSGSASMHDLFRLDSASIPTTSVSLSPRDLTPSTTYSFQESTFGRRLHRACLEGAYHIISNPERNKRLFDRVFQLTWLAHDPVKLLAALKNALKRGPTESLDLFEAPTIHVGGAGTHYSRRDPFGVMRPRKSSSNLGLVGPQTLTLLHQADLQGLTEHLTVEIAGYEGEWFDPYDVEGYLNEKGIYIDPNSSFAEATITEEVDATSTLTLSSPSATPFWVSSDSRPTPLTRAQRETLNAIDPEMVAWDDDSDFEISGLNYVGYTDVLTESWMNTLPPKDANLQRPKRKPVIIDVAKFIKVLLLSTVCLGRTPGFKRKNVDRALAMASFDVI